LDSIRAQENICDTVEETNEVQEWFNEEVTDVWNRRLETLYRFDAVLTIGSGQFEWITDDIQTMIDQQRTALGAYDGDWWTTNGWQTLMAETTTDIGDSIHQSWNEYIETEGLSSLVDRIDTHPWVVPATDLPSSVQDAFEHEYITPLRELQRWYNTMDESIASLTTDDEDALVAATDDIAGMNPYSESMDYTIEALSAKIDRLSAVVGDRTLEDVSHIGIVPDDRESIDQRLERLVEDGELGIEAVDSGVVIR
jgi:hypothetical protein